MAIQRIAFLYPGAMGASLAHTLHTRQSHLTLLTDVSGRSQSTISRSEAAGLINTPLAEIVQRSDLIVSILPPSEALALAKSFVSHLDGRPASHSPPIYLDANAISPASVKTLADILSPHNVPFIDGCVIGLPAREGHDPKLYLSADEKWEKELQAVAEALRGSSQAGEDGKGLKVRVMDRAGEGAASALKMCYGGINKGVIGLASIMIMAANAHSPATAQALLGEMAESQPIQTKRLGSGLPDMIPKAYRFVGEMHEISSFIQASLKSEEVAATYDGLAVTFQRIADDLRAGAGAASASTPRDPGKPDGQEVQSLKDWAEQAREAVDGRI